MIDPQQMLDANISRPEEGVFPRILYIMGTGRSGTTILEVLLANNPGVVGVGECTHIFRDGYIANKACSCGELTSSCNLWSKVRAYCGWQGAVLQSVDFLFNNVSRHIRFPLTVTGLIPRTVLRSYKDINDCLFRAVSSLSKAAVIVDSSKYAGRALTLARIFPGETRIICLTRSPAGLVGAFQKQDAGEQPPKSLLATFFYYLYSMTCFRIVTWLLGTKVLRVRYEDFIENPIGTLNKIEAWGGLNLEQVKGKIFENQWLGIGHIVTGNRLRLQGKVKFQPNMPITTQLPLMQKPLIWVMNIYRTILGF